MDYDPSNPRGEGSSRATAKPNPVRRIWSRNEDEDLKTAVLKHAPVSSSSPAWGIISTEVGNGERTFKDCRKRWFYTLDPTLKKGRWTSEEDQLLRDAFARLGPQWTALALHVPGRTDEQVAKRWKDVLAPELDLAAPWTRAEDTLLFKLHRVHGPKWTLISDAFPRRNGIACRNRHRKWSKSTQDPGQESELAASPGRVHSDAASAFDGREDVIPSDATDSSLLEIPDVTDEDQEAFSQMLQSFMNDSQPGENYRSGRDIEADLGLAHMGGPDMTLPQASSHPLQNSVLSLESWIQDLNETPYRLQEPSFSNSSIFAINNLPTTSGLATIETSPNTSSQEPIRNPWTLFTALENDPGDSLLVSKDLIRKLIADASRK